MRLDSAVVYPHDPALDERSYAMGSRQGDMGGRIGSEHAVAVVRLT